MTDLRCDACGRELADDTAFCPYCGADRRPAPPAATVSAAVPTSEPAVAPDPPTPLVAPALPETPAPPPPPAPVAATTARAQAPPRKTKRLGCATPVLVVLLIVLAGVSWCALHRAPSGGAPAVAGATAAEPIRVSRRWRTVRLPGDAPASARFAVSSDTALRVRAGGELYGVRPRHPLRLPEELGDSIDVRAADYVSADDAARAKAALVTLRGG